MVGARSPVEAEARRLGLPVHDAGGALVLPGFVDAHTHFLHVGVKTTRPDLRGATSLEEALQRVASWLAAHPGSDPVIAEGWDESGWTAPARPHRDAIDAVVAAAASAGHGPRDRPVVLRRICGHIAVAGSGALAKIRPRWPDPGEADHDSGLLLEAPSLYLNEVLPSTPEQLDRAVAEACREAHRLGVTAVGDYSQAPYRSSLQRAAARGTLTVRVASSIYVQQLQDEVAAGFRTGRPGLSPNDLPAGEGGGHWGPVPGRDGGDRIAGGTSPWLHDGGLKVFLDGSLGAHTAYLREPYTDHKHDDGHGHDQGERGAGPRGSRIWTDAELDRHVGTAHAAGIQVHAHAIGDGAIDQGLAAFHRLATRSDLEGAGWNGNALRHRFEHFEIVHPDQEKATAELGLVASSQPNFLGEWSSKGGMYEARLGSRYTVNNRFRSFKQNQIPLAFGSDGMPFGPLVGLAAAVHHPDPTQSLEPLEACWHYTWMAAWSLHWPTLGHLAAGNPADFVVLDAPDEDVNSWAVRQTWTDGLLRFAS
jgi:predicted amidohydrolase YtcJ